MQEKQINKPKMRVLITGNAGAFGQALTRRLLAENEYHLFSCDGRDLSKDLNKVEHYKLDLRRKSSLEMIKKLKPQAIIHLGVIRNPNLKRKKRENTYYFNLESTAQLIKLSEGLNLDKFVYLSTANLYGPSCNTSGFIKEDTPLHGADKSPEFRDLVALDMMVQSCFWKMPNTKTIILRPCHIVGKKLNNAPCRYLRLDPVPLLLGYDPMMQLVHQDDLIDAILLSLASNKRGVYNVAGVDAAPLSRIVKALNKNFIYIPEKLFKLLMASTFLYKKAAFPVGELDHIKYSCLIDDNEIRKTLGYSPVISLKNIIEELQRSAKIME